MRILTKDDIQQKAGRMIMAYGETGTGKTTSILQTVPDPLCYIQTELRPLAPSLEAANRPNLDIDVIQYDTFQDLMEFVSNPANFERYRTIAVDSYSHLMDVGLAQEIEDEAWEARSPAEREKKPLVSQAKMSLEGYGGLSSLMFRLTACLGRLARAGKIVVVTALLQEAPRWNRALAAAPALKGREFPANLPGFFDLIGLVESRTDGDGNIIFPPLVKFENPDGSFLAKYTGRKLGGRAWGPFDLQKLLGGINYEN